MGRFHLIEIHEQLWFPDSLRAVVTDLLQFTLNFTGYYRAAQPLLQAAIGDSGANSVVDLCSGGGGPWPDLFAGIATESAGQPVSLCLTDKFPNRAALEKMPKALRGLVSYSSEPIDAECVPRNLRGFRTLFNSFHHFAGAHAEAVLEDAVKSGQGVAIFEVTQRKPLPILAAIFMGLGALLFLPFVRPFRFSEFVFTYLVPVVPFVLWFDGAVSCLRSHSLAELRELVNAPQLRAFDWRCGHLRATGSPLPVTYLIGLPPQPQPQPPT